MSETPVYPFRTSTDTQTYGLGRTLRAVGIVTGLAVGLVLAVGYPIVAILALAVTLTVGTGWRRFGRALARTAGDGVTHRIRVPFTDIQVETTFRKETR